MSRTKDALIDAMNRNYKRRFIRSKKLRTAFRSKRVRRGRKSQNYSGAIVPVPVQLLGNRKIMHLPYCSQGTIDVGAGGAYTSAYFKANGLFDPDYTGAGHQPLGFDQINLLYNKYIVVGSRITAQFWCEDAATRYMALAGVTVDDDSSGISGLETMIENGKCSWKMMTVDASTQNKATIIKHSFSAKKFFNLTKIRDTVSTFGAAGTADPSQTAYFALFVSHSTEAVNLPAVNYMVQIEYAVIFSEPKELAGS